MSDQEMYAKIDTVLLQCNPPKSPNPPPFASLLAKNEKMPIDSLSLFEMGMAIEEHFGVRVPDEELPNICYPVKLIEFLKAHAN